MYRIAIALLIVSALGLQTRAAENGSCPVLTDSQKGELIKYVRAKYKLSEDTSLRLAANAPVAAACYRLLTFEGQSTLKKWQLKLYLSPDQRYLTTDLLDTSIDPVKEEQARMASLMADLAKNKGATLGPDSAPVTIVEFSDFECPYCRKFDSILHEVLESQAEQVRVVFHHMPLSMHPWARVAAEGAACAQLQNSRAFWDMESRIFKEQTNITPGNVKAKILQISKETSNLDTAAFQMCIENEMSLGLVFRDIELASSNNVNGTPTVFINGHRMEGIHDAAQLLQLISEAKKDLKATTEAPRAPMGAK